MHRGFAEFRLLNYCSNSNNKHTCLSMIAPFFQVAICNATFNCQCRGTLSSCTRRLTAQGIGSVSVSRISTTKALSSSRVFQQRRLHHGRSSSGVPVPQFLVRSFSQCGLRLIRRSWGVPVNAGVYSQIVLATGNRA